MSAGCRMRSVGIGVWIAGAVRRAVSCWGRLSLRAVSPGVSRQTTFQDGGRAGTYGRGRVLVGCETKILDEQKRGRNPTTRLLLIVSATDVSAPTAADLIGPPSATRAVDRQLSCRCHRPTLSAVRRPPSAIRHPLPFISATAGARGLGLQMSSTLPRVFHACMAPAQPSLSP
jgi:hypothetical protein